MISLPITFALFGLYAAENASVNRNKNLLIAGSDQINNSGEEIIQDQPFNRRQLAAAPQHTQHKDGDAMVRNLRKSSTSSYHAKLQKTTWANYASKAAAIGLPLRLVTGMVFRILLSWLFVDDFAGLNALTTLSNKEKCNTDCFDPDANLLKIVGISDIVINKFLMLVMIPLHVFGIRNGPTSIKIVSWAALSLSLILAVAGAIESFFLYQLFPFQTMMETGKKKDTEAVIRVLKTFFVHVGNIVPLLDTMINTAYYVMHL